MKTYKNPTNAINKKLCRVHTDLSCNLFLDSQRPYLFSFFLMFCFLWGGWRMFSHSLWSSEAFLELYSRMNDPGRHSWGSMFLINFIFTVKKKSSLRHTHKKKSEIKEIERLLCAPWGIYFTSLGHPILFSCGSENTVLTRILIKDEFDLSRKLENYLSTDQNPFLKWNWRSTLSSTIVS